MQRLGTPGYDALEGRITSMIFNITVKKSEKPIFYKILDEQYLKV